MGFHDTQYWAQFVLYLVCSFHLMYAPIVCPDYFIWWTLPISTTLYLECLSISNKMFGPLKFSPRTIHNLPLFRTSLSRTVPYIEQIFWSLEPFSLSISNITYSNFIFEFPKNSNLNQNKNLDRK